jgi:hypothetical protein
VKVRAARHLAGEFRRLAREESGMALLMTLGFFLMLYILCCGVYATGETIRQRIELQNACDAAAYSAAVVQADALSRMAVVNRALSWTYVQLCREQMDYIVFSWLKLTCDRFREDFNEKANEGGLTDKRHYRFEDFNFGVFGFNDRHDLHRDAYYCGVTTPTARKDNYVSLNWRTGLDEAESVEKIEGLLEKIGGMSWKKDMEKTMEEHKEAIGNLNATLAAINLAMTKSIQSTVEYVLFQSLPKTERGGVAVEMATNYYWVVAGGVSGVPLAYSGAEDIKNGAEGAESGDVLGSYFDGLGNTEADEIQFLQMADGLPSAKKEAPGWMKSDKRGVMLSDYFGMPGNEDQSGMGITRYVAGGLDQWYVRGPAKEAQDTGIAVKKQVLDPPGGIQRVYKHTNRDEGKTLGKYHRPNHVFQLGLSSAGLSLDGITENFKAFSDPSKLFKKNVDEIKQAVYDKAYRYYRNLGFRRRASREFANEQVDLLLSNYGNTSPGGLSDVVGDIGGMLGQLAGGGLGQLQDALKEITNGDIPPSNEHSLGRYPDQCRNVDETTALVSQYEWASAYWFCPWVCIPPFIDMDFPHIPIPVSAILGCEYHGYDSWLSTQLKVLFTDFGATRNDYRSCFINLDPTVDMNKNTILRGYARIYGDDEEIFNETGYVGAVAMPWILSESFFNGDGTILVGLARRQRNPFARLLSWKKGEGQEEEQPARPSLYEPFSPQPGADRFLVALSTARAAWAPRPDDPVTGMETMNTGTAPGQYDPRWDAVTDNHSKSPKFKGVDGSHGGCVCGVDTEKRLKRMWNLSQTDWDATLLPLRHAYDSHSHYDSAENLKDGSTWEYEDTSTNAVKKLYGILMGEDMKWKNGAALVASQAPSQSPWTEKNLPRAYSSEEILSILEATEGNGESTSDAKKGDDKSKKGEDKGNRYMMFLMRKLL